MRLKDKSVNISALCPELLDRLNWMDIKQRQLVGSELVITSGNDSSHGPNSLHYKNRAIDTRINDWYSMRYSQIRTLTLSSRAITFILSTIQSNDFQ